MTTFPARCDSTCPRCSKPIAEGDTVRMVPTPRGNKVGHIDCTGEIAARPASPQYLSAYDAGGEERSYERRAESIFIGRW